MTELFEIGELSLRDYGRVRSALEKMYRWPDGSVRSTADYLLEHGVQSKRRFGRVFSTRKTNGSYNLLRRASIEYTLEIEEDRAIPVPKILFDACTAEDVTACTLPKTRQIGRTVYHLEEGERVRVYIYDGRYDDNMAPGGFRTFDTVAEAEEFVKSYDQNRNGRFS